MAAKHAPQPGPEWLDTDQAGRLLDVAATSVTKWAREGKLAGSVKGDDGRWLVRRAEVDRILTDQEAVLERRIARREAFQTAPRSGRRPADETR